MLGEQEPRPPHGFRTLAGRGPHSTFESAPATVPEGLSQELALLPAGPRVHVACPQYLHSSALL